MSIYSKIYELKNEVESRTDDEEAYVIASSDEKINRACIAYFNALFERKREIIKIYVKDKGLMHKFYLLDEQNNLTETIFVDNGEYFEAEINPDSVILMESV